MSSLSENNRENLENLQNKILIYRIYLFEFVKAGPMGVT